MMRKNTVLVHTNVTQLWSKFIIVCLPLSLPTVPHCFLLLTSLTFILQYIISCTFWLTLILFWYIILMRERSVQGYIYSAMPKSTASPPPLVATFCLYFHILFLRTLYQLQAYDQDKLKQHITHCGT